MVKVIGLYQALAFSVTGLVLVFSPESDLNSSLFLKQETSFFLVGYLELRSGDVNNSFLPAYYISYLFAVLKPVSLACQLSSLALGKMVWFMNNYSHGCVCRENILYHISDIGAPNWRKATM
jgi:hypothetical protein